MRITIGHTPFADAHFAAVAREAGCRDEGRSWRRRDRDDAVDWTDVGPAGIGIDELDGPPGGMPRFRYGHQEGAAFLSVWSGGYAYHVRRDARGVEVGGTIPEAVVADGAGRRLGEFVQLPGIEDVVVLRVEVDGERVRFELERGDQRRRRWAS